jgi:hypothetical protein
MRSCEGHSLPRGLFYLPIPGGFLAELRLTPNPCFFKGMQRRGSAESGGSGICRSDARPPAAIPAAAAAAAREPSELHRPMPCPSLSRVLLLPAEIVAGSPRRAVPAPLSHASRRHRPRAAGAGALAAAASTSASGAARMAAAARLVVAVDGPAASGKGTLAKALAAAYGLAHLDTGGLYRLVGLAAAREGVDLGDEGRLAELCRHVSLELLEDPAIRWGGGGLAGSRALRGRRGSKAGADSSPGRAAAPAGRTRRRRRRPRCRRCPRWGLWGGGGGAGWSQPPAGSQQLPAHAAAQLEGAQVASTPRRCARRCWTCSATLRTARRAARAAPCSTAATWAPSSAPTPPPSSS